MTLSNNQISAIGIGCLALVIFIVFVPIIAVDTNTESGSTSLTVCVTTPCEDMVVVKEQKTILEFLSDEENVQFLTPLAPDDRPDDVGACIEIYQPVCGTDGNTYGNECKLNLSENVEIDHQGEC